MRTKTGTSPEAGSHGRVKVVLAAGAGNLAIAAAKFTAAAFTGSSAMFSEGVHSLVDTGNQALMLFGFRSAARPASARHPFGYAAETYFYAFVVAVLLFALGSGISFYEGVHKLRDPHPIERVWVNYLVLGFAMVVEGGAWWVAYREFRRTKSRGHSLFRAVRESKDPSIFVVLFEDTAAMLGLIAAFAGVAAAQLTGLLVFDAIASLAIGTILAATAIFLAIETKGLLIGEAARPEIQSAIEAAVKASPFQTERLLTMHLGPQTLLVGLEARAPADWNADRLKEEVKILEAGIRDAAPAAAYIFIEAV